MSHRAQNRRVSRYFGILMLALVTVVAGCSSSNSKGAASSSSGTGGAQGAQGSGDKLTKLSVITFPSSGSMIELYAMKAAKLDVANGLDASLIPVQTGTVALSTLVSNSAQIYGGATPLSVANGLGAGQNVKYFCGGVETGDHTLVVRANSTVPVATGANGWKTTLAALNGKTWG
jgi:hypothetical protein